MRSSEFLNEADPANPYTGKDPVKAAAWAKLSPQIQANIGGADPTDRFIIQAMASGSSFGRSKGINDANPDGTPKVAAAPAAPAAVPAAPAAAPAAAAPAGTGYGDDDTSVFAAPAAPAAPAATPVADAVAASGEPDNVTGVDAAVAANAANTANTVQTTTPPAKAPVRSTISPAILGYASSMGLYKNGQPDTAAIKAFQQKNGLKDDGIIGPNTSGAILSAAKPGDAGSGRGGAGGPTATQVAQAATPAAAPPRPSIGMASQFEWDRQYAKTHNANGTAKGAQAATPAPVDVAKIDAEIKRFSSGNNMSLQANKDYVAGLEKKKTGGQSATPAPLTPRQGGPMRESNFEESVSRMRRLSTLLKG
jgi:hypothetical protein